MLSYFDQYCFTNRSGSPQIPRSIPGQGLRSTRYPDFAGFPFSSRTSASTPGNGSVAEPGLSVVSPGRGVIKMWPVSVCHHVSTTGQRPPPMTFQYQTHASGLIGSPTEPSHLKLDRSHRFGNSSPHFMNVRIAVGAV